MRLNNQAIESRQTKFSNKHEDLDVHSIFYTIQGEGPFAGTPAVFIRLAGCNLQCPACDTDYTKGRRWMSNDEIIAQIQAVAPNFTGLIVITGGEPFRQEITSLVLKLVYNLRCYVQIETNGVLPPPDISIINTNPGLREGVFIVVSPKTGKVNCKTETVACAYKYVLSAHSVDVHDGLPIHVLNNSLGSLRVARPPKDFRGVIYLQPMDEGDPVANNKHLQACVASCMKHNYILQLQLHKILGME